MTLKPSMEDHMSAVIPWSSLSSRSTPLVSTRARAASTLPDLQACRRAVQERSSAAFSCAMMGGGGLGVGEERRSSGEGVFRGVSMGGEAKGVLKGGGGEKCHFLIVNPSNDRKR